MSAPQVEVPVFLTGIVLDASGPSICMDGAKYQLRHHPGASETRLASSNPEVEEFLSRVVGTRQRVTVAGYMRFGPECSHLAVYWAGPADGLFQQLTSGSKDASMLTQQKPVQVLRKDYTGTSGRGSIQEALEDAIKSVPQPGADFLVVWHVKEIAGKQGGFVGYNEVQVTISAST
jgi:hypothetical protein